VTRAAEIIVVGAGLSGLALANRLVADGRDAIVLEARSRGGGRIKSEAGFDLGPAWIWPHNQRLSALIEQLGLQIFSQYSSGRLVFEDASGAIRRDIEMATMGNALRVAGGLAQITDALGEQLADRLVLGETVQRVSESSSRVTLTSAHSTWIADRVVLALPPRLVARMGVQVPDVPTWMAGHAKCIAVYEAPFWRGDGFNGDAISHRGPLAEIHDASPFDASAGALCGFAAPGAARDAEFKNKAIAQLTRLFGPAAAHPEKLLIKDWSADYATATPADLTPLAAHPQYSAIPAKGRIFFAGTETAGTEGGFLEGALEAADAAYRDLLRIAA
jgi:monoamine oxidase